MNNLRAISAYVAHRYGVTVDDLKGPRRTMEFVIPRFVAIKTMRSVTKCSLPMIGRFMHRDHTSIINAIRKPLDAEDEEILGDAIAIFTAQPIFRTSRNTAPEAASVPAAVQPQTERSVPENSSSSRGGRRSATQPATVTE